MVPQRMWTLHGWWHNTLLMGTQHGWCGHGVVGEDKERPPHWHSSTSKEFLFGGISTNQLTVCMNYDEDDTVTLNSCQFHEAWGILWDDWSKQCWRIHQTWSIRSCYIMLSLQITDHDVFCFHIGAFYVVFFTSIQFHTLFYAVVQVDGMTRTPNHKQFHSPQCQLGPPT